VLPGRPQVVLDVAHNPQAARVLAESLESMPAARTLAVFGMLADKDAAGVASAMAQRVDMWLICSLAGPRGAAAEQLVQAVRSAQPDALVRLCESPADAYRQAQELAKDDDRIVAFGSFYTVSGVMQARLSG
jgi:dihydrofolate synthase/folylpolyglutamate synthase